MKTNTMIRILALIILVGGWSVNVSAQESGNGNVVKKAIELPEFTRLSIGGALKVKLSPAPTCQVILEADENLIPQMDIKVVKGELKLNSGSFRKATVMQVEITMPNVSSIEASGASQITCTGTFDGDAISLSTSGASLIHFMGNVNAIDAEMSGASKVTLIGTANLLNAEMSGASKLTAGEMLAKMVEVEASGASKADVNAIENLDIQTSGAAKVTHNQDVKNVEKEGNGAVTDYNFNIETPSGDTVRVDLGNINVTVIDDDSVRVKIGNNSISVDEDGNVKMDHEKCNKFNGHWAGVELGINGLLTSNFDMSYPKSERFLDLRMEKSTNVNINFYEQNIALNKNKTIGLVSGLGLSFNNYRFANDVYIATDSIEFKAYYMDGISVKKSKLTNMYVTVPLFLEFQTNGTKKSERLHFAVGVVGGWRALTHSKIYFNESNKDFSLIDPVSGNTLPVTLRSPDSYNRNITKNFDGFDMHAFKLDAAVRMGWGIVSVYANYSLFPLWIKDKGPQVYPFSVGICLAGW